MAETLEQAAAEIELDRARAILNEAISGGFKDDDIPEDPQEMVADANYWLEEATKAHEAGMQHPTILAILGFNEARDDDIRPGIERPMRSSRGYSEQDLRGDVEIVTGTTDAVAGPHPVKVHIDEVELVIPRGLPIPQDFDDDPSEMPRDLSELTDKGVRKLHGEFNAYGSRAKWLLAIATSDLANATHMRDHAYRTALKAVGKIDPKTDKTKLKEVIDAEAREDAEFARYDAAVLQHQRDVTMLKALTDIYFGNVDRLSREWTMRQDEYNKTH